MQKIFPEKAYWESSRKVRVLFNRDCSCVEECPKILFRGQKMSLQQSNILEFSKSTGYGNLDALCFFFSAVDFSEESTTDYYVAGNFNGWRPDQHWKMAFNPKYNGFCLNVPVEKIKRSLDNSPAIFKFVSNHGRWFEPPESASNVFLCESGFRNWILDFEKTGKHVWEFDSPHTHTLQGTERLQWSEKNGTLHSLNISNFHWLLKQFSTKPLGAIIENGQTIFRLFAPRAKRVRVCFWSKNESKKSSLDLNLQPDGIWELVVGEELREYRYVYYIEGENTDKTTDFQLKPLLDPYAAVALGPNGPGIITVTSEPEKIPSYKTPAVQDLVIVEAHVRDLVANTEFAKNKKIFGFKELSQWIQSPDNYLVDLGINAVELQPVTEFDYTSPEEYHWGYMPVNYFAPSSAYAHKEGSQVADFQDVVSAFHRKNIAVILDVVYNHMGHLNALSHIDKYYYFVTHENGDLTNFSGCGNDLRADAPMVERMIVDSLIHWINVYDVDGFRFDLAELLGVPVLKRIEKAVRKVKPSIILIAEPWSFRKHVGYDLKTTAYSSWNDGYRDFLAQYVWGQGNVEGIRYFLKGSLDHLSRFPAQSVNYTESHDDHSWLDKITERPDKNAVYPTLNDRRRTHLMFASLFMSFGIPMFSAGQDFLRAKNGVRNTYQRGDLNALSYQQREIYSGSNEYVKNWINFRLSPLGQILRLQQKPEERFWQFFYAKNSSAIAVLYNADYSRGPHRLLFAINPHDHSLDLDMVGIKYGHFKQIADTERFNINGLLSPLTHLDTNKFTLPPISCALWAE